MNNDFKPILWMEITLTYKGNTRKCISQSLTYNAKFYETLPNSMDNLIEIFEQHFLHRIEDFMIEQFSSFDKMLKSISDDLNSVDGNTAAIGKMLSNVISCSTFASQSIIQEISLKDCKIFYYKNFRCFE